PLPMAMLAAAAGADEERADRIGAAMLFATSETSSCRRAVEDGCAAEGLEVAAWRAVPVDPSALGDRARATAPAIEQAVLLRPLGSDVDDAERRAFRARRRIEARARSEGLGLYIPSLSFRTITYKALCAADQLAAFYPDLCDAEYTAWFALFHQRYSTNTTPTWERAQPFRFLGHNGEINTIRGNVALLRAREGRLGSDDLAPEDLLRPVVDVRGSDSQILDEALELLVRGGRDLNHAAAMLVPPAWEDTLGFDPEVSDFFAYHSCLLEPWDGPAALVLSDGSRVAAALDRNGLRPLRIAMCEDGLVACASEAGAVSVRGRGRVRRLKLGPGQAFRVDPSGGILEDRDLKGHLARRRPYGDWLAVGLRGRSAGEPLERAANDVLARQVAAGYSKEEFTVVLRPMATEGAEPTSSMGDDTAQAPLASYGRPVFNFLKQRFAQVTNPPIDHLRERHVMSLTTRLGRRRSLLREDPDAAALRSYGSFLLFPSEVADLRASGARPLDATFDLVEGPDGLEGACSRLAQEAETAVAEGAECLVVSDAGAGPERVPVPSALAAGAVHHRLVRAGLRSQASIVVDA
ncbi:MAG: glutamate synthase central domain-containing protein, partial [Actinomycetota bacterium]